MTTQPISSFLNKTHPVDAITLLNQLPDQSVHCIVTSPPYYGLRDYCIDGQIGLEETPALFIENLTKIFVECQRVLCNDGTLWINIGDTYGTGTKAKRKTGKRGLGANTQRAQDSVSRVGGKAKQRLGIPHRLVFALQDAGYIWRDEIVWYKTNAYPESVKDRTTKSHEFVFTLSKKQRYFYNRDAIMEKSSSNSHGGGRVGDHRYMKKSGRNDGAEAMGIVVEKRNRRSVWIIPTEPSPLAHYAMFPPNLAKLMILAGCPSGGIVLDPFMGAGTTGLVASQLGYNFIGSEINPDYCRIANDRLLKDDIAIALEQKSGITQVMLF